MARYAMVNNSTNIVENMVIWDGVSTYEPSGVTLIQTDIPDIGDKCENSKFYRWNEGTQTWDEL